MQKFYILQGSAVTFSRVVGKRVTVCFLLSIGVDLAGILGRRMASAEGGSVPIGVEYGERCPLSSRLRGLGSVVSSPSGVRRKRILA